MAFNIDYDRGVLKRSHGSGLDIYMYIDQPGHYLNSHGTEVTAELARQSGFDTESLGRKRVLNERLADANTKIRAELDAAANERKVEQEVDGFKLVDLGLGNYTVLGPDDEALIKMPIPKQQAQMLFKELIPKGSAKQPTK